MEERQQQIDAAAAAVDDLSSSTTCDASDTFFNDVLLEASSDMEVPINTTGLLGGAVFTTSASSRPRRITSSSSTKSSSSTSSLSSTRAVRAARRDLVMSRGSDNASPDLSCSSTSPNATTSSVDGGSLSCAVTRSQRRSKLITTDGIESPVTCTSTSSSHRSCVSSISNSTNQSHTYTTATANSNTVPKLRSAGRQRGGLHHRCCSSQKGCCSMRWLKFDDSKVSPYRPYFRRPPSQNNPNEVNSTKISTAPPTTLTNASTACRRPARLKRDASCNTPSTTQTGAPHCTPRVASSTTSSESGGAVTARDSMCPRLWSRSSYLLLYRRANWVPSETVRGSCSLSTRQLPLPLSATSVTLQSDGDNDAHHYNPPRTVATASTITGAVGPAGSAAGDGPAGSAFDSAAVGCTLDGAADSAVDGASSPDSTMACSADGSITAVRYGDGDVPTVISYPSEGHAAVEAAGGVCGGNEATPSYDLNVYSKDDDFNASMKVVISLLSASICNLEEQIGTLYTDAGVGDGKCEEGSENSLSLLSLLLRWSTHTTAHSGTSMRVEGDIPQLAYPLDKLSAHRSTISSFSTALQNIVELLRGFSFVPRTSVETFLKQTSSYKHRTASNATQSPPTAGTCNGGNATDSCKNGSTAVYDNRSTSSKVYPTPACSTGGGQVAANGSAGGSLTLPVCMEIVGLSDESLYCPHFMCNQDSDRLCNAFDVLESFVKNDLCSVKSVGATAGVAASQYVDKASSSSSASEASSNDECNSSTSTLTAACNVKYDCSRRVGLAATGRIICRQSIQYGRVLAVPRSAAAIIYRRMVLSSDRFVCPSSSVGPLVEQLSVNTAVLDHLCCYCTEERNCNAATTPTATLNSPEQFPTDKAAIQPVLRDSSACGSL
eukprot:Lankesteria_metandrocarpae@DN3309_c0_g1_i3.p1